MRFIHHFPLPHNGSLRLLYFSLVCLVLLQACLGPLPASRPVCGNCEDPDHFVRLEKVGHDFPSDVRSPYSHPFTLTSDEWTQILSTIYVQQLKPGFLIWGEKGDKEPAFTNEEIHYLSKNFPKAFQEAQSDEIVVYALTRSTLPEMSEISTGGIFVKNDAIHLIFSNYRYAVSMTNVRELVWERPLLTKAITYTLIPGNFQTLVPPDFWKIKDSPLMMTIAFKDFLMESAPSLKMQGGRPPSTSSLPDRSSPQDLSIEEQLEMLKRMKERNLITDEDFQKKKNELLDRF